MEDLDTVNSLDHLKSDMRHLIQLRIMPSVVDSQVLVEA